MIDPIQQAAMAVMSDDDDKALLAEAAISRTILDKFNDADFNRRHAALNEAADAIWPCLSENIEARAAFMAILLTVHALWSDDEPLDDLEWENAKGDFA